MKETSFESFVIFNDYSCILKVTNVMLLEKLQVIESCTWQRELQFVMPVEKACTTIFLSSKKKCTGHE